MAGPGSVAGNGGGQFGRNSGAWLMGMMMGRLPICGVVACVAVIAFGPVGAVAGNTKPAPAPKAAPAPRAAPGAVAPGARGGPMGAGMMPGRGGAFAGARPGAPGQGVRPLGSPPPGPGGRPFAGAAPGRPGAAPQMRPGPAAAPHQGAVPAAAPRPGRVPAASPHPSAVPAAAPHPGAGPFVAPHSGLTPAVARPGGASPRNFAPPAHIVAPAGSHAMAPREFAEHRRDVERRFGPGHDAVRDREFVRAHEHDFHTRDVREFDDVERARWSAGVWHDDWHYGRWGWWYDVDGVWYPYATPIYPYPVTVAEIVVPDTVVIESRPDLVPVPGALVVPGAPVPVAAPLAVMTTTPAGEEMVVRPLPMAPVVTYNCAAVGNVYPAVRLCPVTWAVVAQ